MDNCTVSIQMQIIFENQSATRAVAQATAQGFQLHEPELWAFLSLNDGPTRPGFGKAGPGWLTALGRARHITRCYLRGRRVEDRRESVQGRSECERKAEKGLGGLQQEVATSALKEILDPGGGESGRNSVR